MLTRITGSKQANIQTTTTTRKHQVENQKEKTKSLPPIHHKEFLKISLIFKLILNK